MNHRAVILVVLILITGGTAFSTLYFVSHRQPRVFPSHIYYLCESEAAPLGTSFTIEKQADGQYHLVIASKPPETDIIVKQKSLGGFDYEYSGDGIDVKDSSTTLQVFYGGKKLKNCRKLYPGV